MNLLKLGIIAIARLFSELDYMEYNSDASAQAAYVTDGVGNLFDFYSESNVNTSLLSQDLYGVHPGGPGVNSSAGIHWTATGTFSLTSIKFYLKKVGTPTGNAKVYLYADNGSGIPGAELATSSSIDISTVSTNYTLYEFTFSTPYLVQSGTVYHLVLEPYSGTLNASNKIRMGVDDTNASSSYLTYYGTNSWGTYGPFGPAYYIYGYSLQSYSEAAIKIQGSYSLKGIASITGSLNKTLTKTISSPKDLTGKSQIKFDIRSSRTGSNIKLGIHDGEVINQQNTTVNSTNASLGNVGFEIRRGQSFVLSSDSLITALEVKEGDAKSGTPTGGWTLRIETDSSGLPSGTLADANATVNVTPPGANTAVKVAFSTPFTLIAGVKYWIVFQCANQTPGNYWNLSYNGPTDVYIPGDFAYSVTGGIGGWSIITNYDFYFKVFSGNVTVEITPNILSANEWQTVAVDLFNVPNASKNSIDKIIITPVNADADNTFYIDNLISG